MYKLGYYSGDEFSSLRLTPTSLDRILEGVAAILFVSIWGAVIYIYLHYSPLEAEMKPVLYQAGIISGIMVLVAWSSYVSTHYIRFPFRLTERNVVIQYRLVLRLARVLNIFLGLLGVSRAFHGREFLLGIHPELYTALEIAMIVMLVLSIAVYYLLAYRYR